MKTVRENGFRAACKADTAILRTRRRARKRKARKEKARVSPTYSAPFSASTMSILRLFRATSRPTARETPKVRSTLTQ